MKIFNIYLNGVYFDTVAAYTLQQAIKHGEDCYARDTDIVTAKEVEPESNNEIEPTESENKNDTEGSR